jgi:para-nitrobenzyl esterase
MNGKISAAHWAMTTGNSSGSGQRGSVVADASGDDLVVRVETGLIRGAVRGDTLGFLGIPYAAPPVGPLRWRAPLPAAAWPGVRDATAAPPRCHQLGALQPPPGVTQSEDCLYLNVTAPRQSGRWPLPVMVWIHGGAFVNGAGSDYDATRLVRDGEVIVVTINYRLGVFGFFGYPGLDGSGTFGLQDQQAALAWVRRNAAAFGGDPGNITLFGESAGSMSACAQLVSPSAVGLFDKAILQSGSSLQRWEKNLMHPGAPAYEPFARLSVVEARGLGAAKALQADAIEALRAVPAEALMAAFPEVQVAYDTPLLPGHPGAALKAGRIHKAPLIWGGTRDEHRAYVSFLQPDAVPTEASYAALLKDSFGDRADDVARLYPVAEEGAVGAWARLVSDAGWSCHFFESFRAASKTSSVYAYDFADDDAPNPAFDMPAGFAYKAGHAAELAYLFELGGVAAKFSPEQRALAAQMVSYWTRFAWTGDPNGGGTPPWRPFEPAEAAPFVLSLTPPPGGPAPVDFAALHNCGFWAAMRPPLPELTTTQGVPA